MPPSSKRKGAPQALALLILSAGCDPNQKCRDLLGYEDLGQVSHCEPSPSAWAATKAYRFILTSPLGEQELARKLRLESNCVSTGSLPLRGRHGLEPMPERVHDDSDDAWCGERYGYLVVMHPKSDNEYQIWLVPLDAEAGAPAR